ncbi:MAG: autotransporter [Chlamydiota bacterium]
MRTIKSVLIASVIASALAGAAMGQQQAAVPQAAPQEVQPAAGEVTPDPWPKTADQGGAKYTVYQPQLENWDGYNFAAMAAVSVLPPGAKDPVFGVIDIAATTLVPPTSRTVEFHGITIKKATFPSVPDKAEAYRQGFQAMVTGAPTISLDRLDAMLKIQGAEKKARMVPVENAPPEFVFAQSAAVLVSIDGDPVWSAVAGTRLEHAVNTRALLLRDDSSGRCYIHLFDGFVEAPALSGPWTAAKTAPPGAQDAASALAKANVVDLMEGPPDAADPKKMPSLGTLVPRVIVATKPTELIVTQGQPVMETMLPLMLLYVNNTTANVFIDLDDQNTYVLVAGRWFRAPDLKGPWQYVAGKDLPSDFAKIPDDSPKENVKASVPGTAQAQESVIENGIPHSAVVYRAKALFTPRLHGEPVMKPIPDTALSYVCNTDDPIIAVSPTGWYAVKNGVWFTAASVNGPWAVASSVPAAVYSIPPSSPLHFVTYVKIYAATPEYVVDGYTSGYLGTVVTPDNVVVYGTGYDYAPFIEGSAWYPQPVTYGYAANQTWTPWTGWTYGYGLGWGWSAGALASGYWGYAPAPYWGAARYAGGAASWGSNGWAATTGRVYQQWGSTAAVTRGSAGYNAWTGNAWSSKVGYSYNSTTGRISAGQRGEVQNVYTGNTASGARGATYNPTTGVTAKGGYAAGADGAAGRVTATGPGGGSATVARVGNNYYAGRDGNVYKDTGGGWQKQDSGGWNSVSAGDQLQSLQSHQQARQSGDARSAGASWGSDGWGGGFSGDGERVSGNGTSFGGDSFGGEGGDRFGADGFGGGDRFGGDSFGGDRFGGGGGFNRGGFGGGGRSWGGGSFGGGGFRGGGGRGGGGRR